MHNPSETRAKARIHLSIEYLDELLQQVFAYYETDKSQQTENWQPKDPEKKIKLGFWLELTKALFMDAKTSNSKEKGKEREDDDIVEQEFSYTPADELGEFERAWDTPEFLFSRFKERLKTSGTKPSPLALHLRSVVRAFFKSPFPIIGLRDLPHEGLQEDPELTQLALMQNAENLGKVNPDFLVKHASISNNFIKFALNALAKGSILPKQLLEFRKAFQHASLAIPKLKVTSQQEVTAVFTLLAEAFKKIQQAELSEKTHNNDIVREIFADIDIDWDARLMLPGDAVFSGIACQPELLTFFFPTAHDKPLTQQAITALSKMGMGIALGEKVISRTEWLLLYEQIAPKIMDGINLYLQFLDGGACIGNKGFFTHRRHGQKGRERAERLKNVIKNTMQSADPSDYFKHIKDFFTAPDTRFHNNSLSNYIRRELKKLSHDAPSDSPNTVTYEQACEIFAIDDQRFTHALPESSYAGLRS